MASSGCSDSGIPPSASTLSQESIQEPDLSTISSSDEDTGTVILTHMKRQ